MKGKFIGFMVVCCVAFSALASANVMIDQINKVIAKKEAKKRARLQEDPRASYAFVFIYSSHCPYCRRFAPLVRELRDHYHMGIYAITVDGHDLPEFPSSLHMTRGMQQVYFGRNIMSYPQLFLQNVYTMKFIPIAKGYTAYDVVANRVDQILARTVRAHEIALNQPRHYPRPGDFHQEAESGRWRVGR